MNLPKEEQNVLNVLLEAKGQPFRAKAISEMLGIQDNHCNKLIKYLRDKGWWIQNRFCTVNGITKKYKEHWIDPKDRMKSDWLLEAHEEALGLNEPTATPRQGLYQVNIPCPNCGSFYRKNGQCNKKDLHKTN